jgi:hypothetical protein
MGTRARGTLWDIQQDGDQVLSKFGLSRVQAALKKANKGRKVPLLPPGLIKALRKDLADFTLRIGGQQTIQAKKKAATVTEQKTREALAAACIPVRDAITLTPGVSAQNAAAFGRGRRLKKDSTASVLAFATAILDAAKTSAGKVALRDAGIGPAVLKDIADKRNALQAASTAQSTTVGTGREATAETQRLARAVRAGTAGIRKVMRFVLADQPALFKQFASTIARAAPKKRPAPPGNAAAAA